VHQQLALISNSSNKPLRKSPMNLNVIVPQNYSLQGRPLILKSRDIAMGIRLLTQFASELHLFLTQRKELFHGSSLMDAFKMEQ